jgi:hypothetical protein
VDEFSFVKESWDLAESSGENFLLSSERKKRNFLASSTSVRRYGNATSYNENLLFVLCRYGYKKLRVSFSTNFKRNEFQIKKVSNTNSYK